MSNQRFFKGQRIKVANPPVLDNDPRSGPKPWGMEAIIVESKLDCKRPEDKGKADLESQFMILTLKPDGSPREVLGWYSDVNFTLLSDDRAAGELLIEANAENVARSWREYRGER